MENDIIRDEITSKWLKGIPYEVAFWRSYYGSKRRRADLFKWSQYNKTCTTDNFDIQTYLENLSETSPIVVDVGCALSYALGNLFPNRKDVKLEYVDPLASFYNKILDDYKIDRPHIKFGMIEIISGLFSPGSISLMHVRNALDHCADPMRGIIECLACLGIGKILYLNHKPNEAIHEGYRGFHKWNVDLNENGNLILWNKNTIIDVASELKGVANVAASKTAEGRIVGVITKTAELPKSIYNAAETAQRASIMMLATVQHFHSAPRALSYQLSRLWTTIGHRTMRLVPYWMLNRIKRLLAH